MNLEKVSISKIGRQKSYSDSKFSILIPSWNNLAFLKLCIKSIKENSTYKHQIIIILNEALDGSLEWVKSIEDLDYVYAKENIGICYGLNSARSLIKTNYVAYVNDDMYLCPNWDKYLLNEIESLNTNYFMLSATMIEAKKTGNNCVIVKDFGSNPSNFKEEELLAKYNDFEKKDWSGSTWPPNIIHIDIWDLVGGMSSEFSPGFYSDPDLSVKLWNLGVRYFKGLANSRVYHFGSVSTKKIKQHKGRNIFLRKWGFTSKFFTKNYLNRGNDFDSKSKDLYKESFLDVTRNKFKLLVSIFKT